MGNSNGSMKVLKRVSGEFIGITPITHIELFYHCSGGAEVVHPHVFKNTVKPLLLVHGIKEIQEEYKR